MGLQSLRDKLAREGRRILAQGKTALYKYKVGEKWQTGVDEFARRDYPSYDAYVEHQRTKFDAFRARSIERHDQKFFAALIDRIAALPIDIRGTSILCLGARQGTEVRAFIDRGAFAVGIDLNPGRDNYYVLPGDFHNLQFATGSIHLVYTNSLDHAFDLPRLLGEVKRVLAHDGYFLAEVAEGTTEGVHLGFWEATAWPTTAALLDKILEHGFKLVHRSTFGVPWSGSTLLLRKESGQ